MQTLRPMMIAAIKNVFLIWGTALIAMTWMYGRPTIGQVSFFYSLGASLVLLHFVMKFSRKESGYAA